MREEWLNGWYRQESSVIMGTGAYCAGCGRCFGMVTVAISEGYKYPDKNPDWPFEATDCPVCANRKRFEDEVQEAFKTWPPTTVSVYKKLKELQQQLAYNTRVANE